MKSAKRWMAVVLTLVPVIVVALTMASSASAGNAKVLILDSSVVDGASSVEAQAAIAAGRGVDVVDAATWSGMTTAEFAAYDAIVISDGQCGGDQSAAVANAATWSAAVTGNVVASGLDPGYHSINGDNEAGASAFITAGIRYALGDAGGTGAYLSIGCQGSADLLSQLSPQGPFGYADESGDDVHVVASGAPTELAGLTDADLSNWSSSYHGVFATYPSDFSLFADNDSGDAVVVTRGASSTTPSPRGGYCSVAGNRHPWTGAPLTPGAFLDLALGQADSDPNYKGAVPANYLEGVGITCDMRPGFTKTGEKVGYGGSGDPGGYEYYKKG